MYYTYTYIIQIIIQSHNQTKYILRNVNIDIDLMNSTKGIITHMMDHCFFIEGIIRQTTGK